VLHVARLQSLREWKFLRFLPNVFRGISRYRDAAPSSRASDVHNRSGFTSSDVDGVRRDDGGSQPQCMQ